MNWLFPSVVATLIGTVVLASTYAFLYRSDRQDFLGIWACAWFLYSVRFSLMLLYLSLDSGAVRNSVLIGNQLASLGSGVLLLWGSYRFVGKQFPVHWIYITVAFFIYVLGLSTLQPGIFLLSLPVFLFLGWVYVWTGILFIRQRTVSENATKYVGALFILWGLHKADYPFLRPLLGFAPWGYLLGAVLELFIAIGMLMVYFQRAQRITRKNQEALAESEKKYRIILESMEEGYHEVDLKGRFTFFNKSFQRILGYSSEELMGMSYREYAADETNRKRVADAYRRVFDTGESLRDFVWNVVRKDGVRRSVEVSAYLIRDKSNNAVGFRGLVRDITEQRQAELEKEKLQDQLNQAQKMESIGRLAGGVAHDFNNMLGVIIANAEMANMQLASDEPVHHNVQEILKASHRSADTVRQLLAYARKQIISPKILDLNDTISGGFELLRRLIGEDIHLRFVPQKNVWKVRMDPSQLQQVLSNLVINSRDVMPYGGTITIETKNTMLDETYCRSQTWVDPGDYARIRVTDTGEGMSPEVMSHLFDPFFTTKEVGKGTGLGLAMVYGAIRQNGGYIQVESEPGKGTTFMLYLPRVKSEETVDDEQLTDMKPVRGGDETVLLAEDEAALLDTCQYVLKRQGYTVLTARSPGEALELATGYAGEVHLLLTDVVMPEMDGRKLAEELKSFYPALKTLYMSGYTADVITQHGIIDQQMDFIEKPFTFTGLAEKVRKVLDKD